MLPKRSNVLFCRSLSITIACGAVVMLLLFSACSGRHKDMGDAITERDSLPVMDTKGVMTLISDSGVTVFNVEASVKADTAYYYEKQKLWKLMSNVDIQNLKGERFETDLLYWDQNKHTIYSDQFIRIEQPDRIITGHGFDSNEQMTIYTIRKPEGIFYVDDDATAPADSLQTGVQTGSVRTDSIKP